MVDWKPVTKIINKKKKTTKSINLNVRKFLEKTLQHCHSTRSVSAHSDWSTQLKTMILVGLRTIGPGSHCTTVKN